MRKLLAMILCISMLSGAMPFVSFARDYVLGQDIRVEEVAFDLGDVNDDGSLDAKDALFMTANIKGVTGYPMNSDAADFTADGSFDAKDLYYEKLCLSGAKSPADFGDGLATYKFTIAGNDISEYCVLLPEGTTEEDNLWFAYLNLMQYVRFSTGVELPACFGTPVTERYIHFNKIGMDTEMGQHLGYEGYNYVVEGGNLIITGTYRGNMYGVFEILEEYLGYRFYDAWETFVYKNRVVDIPEGTFSEVIPTVDFRFARHTFQSSDAPHHFFPNRLNGSPLSGWDEPFYGIKTGPFFSNAHSFNEYWRMGTGTMPDDPNMTLREKYDAKMASGEVPDPYAWQPCATSDEDFNILFQGMLDCNRMVMSWGRQAFTAEGLTMFSFSIADNGNYCTCRACTLFAKGNEKKGIVGEGYSGLYLHLYNRATEDAQTYYPGVHLYGIVYAKDFPKTIKPHEKFVIVFCGVCCHNHILGKEECYPEGGQLRNMNNVEDLIALDYWSKMCAETGTQLWFWMYPVTYHYYLSCCPNIPNIYWNMRYLYDIGVNGFFYEGGGQTYNFETLKEWLAVKFMWNPEMTYDEFVEEAKEFLYITYGDGYEELYQFILLQTEAGDQCGTCFVNNYDRPGDMYSYEFLAEHYDEMRGLLESALEKVHNDVQKNKVETLIACCDFMGLSSLHTDWYLNGENVELYKERYDWMFDFMHENDMIAFSTDEYTIPQVRDYEENPMIQVYDFGSRREGVYP